jgi:hypothetical protein
VSDQPAPREPKFVYWVITVNGIINQVMTAESFDQFCKNAVVNGYVAAQGGFWPYHAIAAIQDTPPPMLQTQFPLPAKPLVN